MSNLIFLITAIFMSVSAAAHPDPARGFANITTKPYQNPFINEFVFDNLWQSWEPALKAQAEAATPAERRRMSFDRYGFIEAPYENQGLPMGFVAGANGAWHVNCLNCHGGRVAGMSIPGLPNNRLDLQTFVEDMTITGMILQGQTPPPRPIDLGIWMNRSRGTTNAFDFTVHFLKMRDANIDLLASPVSFGDWRGMDMDAPPWWNVSRKSRFYADGFIEASTRSLMQFVMNAENSGERIRGWLPDFEDVRAWLDSMQPPAYPFEINPTLASQGREVFARKCAECHGTYGPGGEYPSKVVPIGLVRTDSERLYGITPEFRDYYRLSWFANYGAENIVVRPEGYIAPPLNGIWASAPYFHNGSVPTVYQVLKSSERPRVWKMCDGDSYDAVLLGLEVDAYEGVPEDVQYAFERRRYFDTTVVSKGNGGHQFGDRLTEDERLAVIEYLKTL